MVGELTRQYQAALEEKRRNPAPYIVYEVERLHRLVWIAWMEHNERESAPMQKEDRILPPVELRRDIDRLAKRLHRGSFGDVDYLNLKTRKHLNRLAERERLRRR